MLIPSAPDRLHLRGASGRDGNPGPERESTVASVTNPAQAKKIYSVPWGRAQLWREPSSLGTVRGFLPLLGAGVRSSPPSTRSRRGGPTGPGASAGTRCRELHAFTEEGCAGQASAVRQHGVPRTGVPKPRPHERLSTGRGVLGGRVTRRFRLTRGLGAVQQHGRPQVLLAETLRLPVRSGAYGGGWGKGRRREPCEVL